MQMSSSRAAADGGGRGVVRRGGGTGADRFAQHKAKGNEKYERKDFAGAAKLYAAAVSTLVESGYDVGGGGVGKEEGGGVGRVGAGETRRTASSSSLASRRKRKPLPGALPLEVAKVRTNLALAHYKLADEARSVADAEAADALAEERPETDDGQAAEAADAARAFAQRSVEGFTEAITLLRRYQSRLDPVERLERVQKATFLRGKANMLLGEHERARLDLQVARSLSDRLVKCYDEADEATATAKSTSTSTSTSTSNSGVQRLQKRRRNQSRTLREIAALQKILEV